MLATNIDRNSEAKNNVKGKGGTMHGGMTYLHACKKRITLAVARGNVSIATKLHF